MWRCTSSLEHNCSNRVGGKIIPCNIIPMLEKSRITSLKIHPFEHDHKTFSARKKKTSNMNSSKLLQNLLFRSIINEGTYFVRYQDEMQRGNPAPRQCLSLLTHDTYYCKRIKWTYLFYYIAPIFIMLT